MNNLFDFLTFIIINEYFYFFKIFISSILLNFAYFAKEDYTNI